MCQKCGCNTCESIRGPLLTESRVKKLVSENLQYHINENIPLMESVFRIGSDAHLSIIKEARKLYSRGVLDLCEEDEGIIKTHLGEFDLYEDEIVPLDLPMVNEDNPIDRRKIDLLNKINNTLSLIQKDGEDREEDIEDLDVSMDAVVAALTNQSPLDVDVDQSLFGRFADPRSDNEKRVKEAVVQALTERKKKKKKTKKDPPIGKPKRGGSKAYYVYVRDPKTKRIKKVSFGSGGLRAKIRNPKARKAFAARHKCSQKTDRTKASYWSCRLPRYASQLGLGANMNTFW